MKLKEALQKLKAAIAPEDIFGDLTGDKTEALSDAYRDLARVTHSDLYPDPKEKKLAEEAFKLLGEFREKAEKKIADGTYGDRTAMASEVIVKTKTNVYTVTQRLASGDLCEVYGATDKDKKRVALKVTRTPANNDLVLNEAERLQWLWEEAPTRTLKVMAHIPKLLDTFELKQGGINKRVNVLERLDGYFTLEEILSEYPEGLDIRDAAWMFNRLLGALGAIHQAGIVHGAVTPSNFMVCPDKPNTHNGVLLDWCYSVKKDEAISAICPKFKAFYPGEVFNKKPATTGVDTYMASMCLLHLIGGNVLMREFPARLPTQIKGILRACWLSARQRTDDVFELHKDFGAAIGPRRFRQFHMPALAVA